MAHSEATTDPFRVRPNLPLRFGFGAGVLLVVVALSVFWIGGSRVLLGDVPSIADFFAGAIGLAIVGACSFVAARNTRGSATSVVDSSADQILGFEQRVRELEEQVRQLGRYNNELEERGDELESMGRELALANRASGSVVAALRPYCSFVDRSYTIDSRYSHALEKVFDQELLGGKQFLDVLERLVAGSTHSAAREYLALLFDPAQDEGALADANPLDSVAIGVRNVHGAAERRYVGFRFGRVVEDDVVMRILVNVADVTERTLREQRLRQLERQKAKHYDTLMDSVHVPEEELEAFVLLSKQQLAAVDDALDLLDISSSSPLPEPVRQSLGTLLQHAHNLSGNAARLRLVRFEKTAHGLERRIADMRQRGFVGGGDVVSLASMISDFWADLEELQIVRASIAERRGTARDADEETDDLVASVAELAATLGQQYGKPVRIDAGGFDTRELPPDRRLVIKDVLVALVRNSLVHGIESPIERETARKPRVATIDIHPVAGASGDAFAFTFRDDGRGLDAERIRARALESGLLATDGETDDAEIASFIFLPGFSTLDRSLPGGNRGMGMNVVKQRVVDDCGGEIEIDSEPGLFCEFSFVLPARREHAIAS